MTQPQRPDLQKDLASLSTSSPAVLASDAERENMVEQLREATAEGRLTLEELAERSEAAYLARTRAELLSVGEDLPHVTPPSRRARPDSAPSAPPSATSSTTARFWSTASRRPRSSGT